MANVDTGGYLLTAKQPADWQITTSAAGPSASVTRGGVAGQSHYLCGVVISSSAGNGDWVIQQGATVIAQGYTKGPVIFSTPLLLPQGAALTVTLQNAGADTCKVAAWGYTR